MSVLHGLIAGRPRHRRGRVRSANIPLTAVMIALTLVPSTTMPVFCQRTVSGAPPERPHTTGTPHADASRNTMPRPSIVQAGTLVRVRHGEHVAHRVIGGQLVTPERRR